MGGYHLVAAIYRSGLKSEMRAYLQTHKDERFGTYLNFSEKEHQISDPNFEWEEVDEEFTYQGEMYDVVSINHQNGQILICALKDDKENHLERQVAEIRHTGNESKGIPFPTVFKFFSSFCFWNQNNTIQLFDAKQPNFAFHQYTYPSLDNEILTPPPQI